MADAVIGQAEGLPGHSIAELVAAISTMNAEIARLGLALDEVNTMHANDQAAPVAATTAANAEMARSWRLTAPLRAAVGLVRGRGA